MDRSLRLINVHCLLCFWSCTTLDVTEFLNSIHTFPVLQSIDHKTVLFCNELGSVRCTLSSNAAAGRYPVAIAYDSSRRAG